MQSRRLLVALKLYLLVALVGGMVVLSGPRPEPAKGASPVMNGKIAFTKHAVGDSNLEIYVIDADGSAETQLTSNPAGIDSGPAWSPDGSQIAFQSDRDGTSFDIFVVNEDGTGLVQLTDTATFDCCPAWSPDGEKIAFRSDRDGNGEIYVMNPDGSGQTRLTNNSATDSLPAWSPDGLKMAFSNYETGFAQIYAMNADGSGATNLMAGGVLGSHPSWSPDGTKIVHEGENFQIYLMDADGGNRTALTSVSFTLNA